MRSLLDTVAFIKKFLFRLHSTPLICACVLLRLCWTNVCFCVPVRCISCVCFCQFPKIYTWAGMRNKKLNWYGLIYIRGCHVALFTTLVQLGPPSGIFSATRDDHLCVHRWIECVGRSSSGEEAPKWLCPVEGEQARGTSLGQSLGSRPPWMAYRVLCHVLVMWLITLSAVWHNAMAGKLSAVQNDSPKFFPFKFALLKIRTFKRFARFRLPACDNLNRWLWFIFMEGL